MSPILMAATFLSLTLAFPSVGVCQSQQGAELGSSSPHGIGDYVGLTKCAACHFDQYKDWKGSEHNRAFDILPVKYRTDATCLECHTTGGATDTTTQQFGVSCESCHGPGEEHSKYALQFVNELITEEGLTTLRGKIQRLDMVQCVKCHISKAHKKHPPFDRDEALPPPSRVGSVSFFDRVHGAEGPNERVEPTSLGLAPVPAPTRSRVPVETSLTGTGR